jgi:hypothetical protein
MKPLTTLQLTMWWITFALQAGIAVGMLRRRLVREMPVFFGYTIFHLVQFFVEMAAYKTSYLAFFYVYWTTEIIDALLTFLIIQEIFGIVFRPYESLRRIGVVLFRCTLLLLIGVSILIASGGSRNTDFSARVHGLVAVQTGTLFVQAGMIFFLVLFSRLFGLSWRNYVFGISLGFGVMACISGVSASLVTHVPPRYTDWCRVLTGYGFTAGIAIWLYYIFAPNSSSEVIQTQIDGSPLKEWNHALQGILDR